MSDQILVYEDRENIELLRQYLQRNTRTLCDNIGSIYWDSIKKDIDAFYIYGKPIGPYSIGSELIKGFLIAKFYPDHAHILLVCARRGTSGIGLRLIDRFIEDVRAKGYNQVTLDALPQVIKYYRNKFGFKLSKTCEEDPAVQQSLTEMASFNQPNFLSMDEVHQDPYMVGLLNRIIDLGLAANPGCKAARTLSRRRKDLDYLNTCSTDGYTMTLCLEPLKKRADPVPSGRSKRVKVS